MVSDSKTVVTTTDEFVAARLPDMKIPVKQQPQEAQGTVDTEIVAAASKSPSVPETHPIVPETHPIVSPPLDTPLPPVAATASIAPEIHPVVSPPQTFPLDAPLPQLTAAASMSLSAPKFHPSPLPALPQILTLDTPDPLPPLLDSPGPAVFTPPPPSPAPPITTTECHPSGYRQNVAATERRQREERDGWLVWFRKLVDGVNEKLFGWRSSR
ncbi:hypothetical protein K440DRAFT_658398 [Wilcoxina mikolae CBS 423.85]|nr:hypothetical protein K440DRAFT_658398 [Wilcoxina mikolae CBS 423.85]